MPKVLLTSSIVRSFRCNPTESKSVLLDSKCRGLALEVRKSGGRTFYLHFTDHRGKSRQLRLGNGLDLSLTQARKLADIARVKIALGEDPVEQRRLARSVPRFAAFIDEHYLPYVRTYKRSWATDLSLLRNHLLPRFGLRYMDDIKRSDIVKMHAERKASGAAAGSANRLVILMRYIFNLAIRWDVPSIKYNPCTGVPLLPVNNSKERYLNQAEAKRLYDAVCCSENPMLKFIVPMLILTGARKREVLDAKWQDFDLARRIWRISMSKSGKARHVPLSDGALSLLASIPRIDACVWAFANRDTLKPYVSIYSAWNTARIKAGFPEVRMHDLRHSFASLLINSGRSLYEVQHILGHTQVKTTQRYAHLSQDTLLAAANAATHALDGYMVQLNPNFDIAP